MIILLILVTFSIEYVLVLWGENWCWSLLGLGSSLFPIPVVIKWCHGGSRGGALGPPPPFIFRPKWGQKGRKKLFADRSPPLSKGLDDHHPPPLISRSGSGTVVNMKSYFVNWIHFTCSKNIIRCIIQLFLHFNSAGQNHWNDEKSTNFAWWTKRLESNLLLLSYVFACLFFYALWWHHVCIFININNDMPLEVNGWLFASVNDIAI